MDRHDPDTLARMVPHVRYEYGQLVGALELLGAGIGGGTGPAHNAALESLLAHVRNLDEFLGRRADARGVHPTDVLAVDLAPGWTPSPVLTEAERTAVNRKLAHVSTDRLLEHDGWPVLDLARRTAERFVEFLAQLDSDDRELRRRF